MDDGFAGRLQMTDAEPIDELAFRLRNAVAAREQRFAQHVRGIAEACSVAPPAACICAGPVLCDACLAHLAASLR